MGMRKIFFGTIVFFSLAFLAACGSGSSGSKGADGADGAAGTAGTISVPTAGSEALTVLQKDLDSDIRDIDIIFNLAGADNLSSDSRVRYYLYEGTAADTKSKFWDISMATTGTQNTPTITGTLDTRELTADDVTLDTSATANQEIEYEGRSGYLIACKGNEAGDATSCANVAIRDRLNAGTGALDAQYTDTSGAGFLTVSTSIAYGNSVYVVLSDNSTAALDNGTMSWVVHPDNFTRGDAYAGVTLTQDNSSDQVNVDDNNTVISNIAFVGTDAYFVSMDNHSNPTNAIAGLTGTVEDNITLYLMTSGQGSAWAIDNESDITNTEGMDAITGAGEADYVPNVIQLGGADTFLHIAYDNNSPAGSAHSGITNGLAGAVWDTDNSTLTQIAASEHVRIDTTTMCSNSESGKMIVVVDNGTAAPDTGFDVIALYDNATLESLATGLQAFDNGSHDAVGIGAISACSLVKASSTYVLALAVAAGTDNITVLSSDNLTGWDVVYNDASNDASISAISLAAPNGTGDVWVATDDGTNIDLYHSDNGTSGTLVVVHSEAAELGGILHDGGAAGSGKIVIASDDGSGVAGVNVYFE